MGTRGTYGVRIDGADKLSYNHFDSYPGGLGNQLLGWLREVLAKEGGLEALRAQARALRLMDEEQAPDPVAGVAAALEGRRPEHTWYDELLDLQGDLGALLERGLMPDANGFINDSLFCEWGYIVNLDDEVLEVYRGFQRKYHRKGRYVKRKPKDWKPRYPNQEYYYPCALAAAIPFGALPESLSADEEGRLVLEAA